MPTLDWQLSHTEGVTLVELLVTAETTTQVRIESTLTPVWPPRRQGVPAAGWDGNSFETTVAAGDRVVVGYASPAEPDGPPARLATEQPGTADETLDPRALVRALGEANPPRDLVPADEAPQDPAESQPTDDEPAAVDGATPLQSWFRAVEQRLADAERLAGVESPEEASAAVAAVGGIEAVKQLQAQLAADRERLDRLAERNRRLDDRLRGVEIPTAVLERVA